MQLNALDTTKWMILSLSILTAIFPGEQQINTKLFTGQMPFLLPNRQCQSTAAKQRMILY